MAAISATGTVSSVIWLWETLQKHEDVITVS